MAHVAQPCQMQPLHDLPHTDLSAAARAPNAGMEQTGIEKIAETVLPSSRGDVEGGFAHGKVGREIVEEYLAFDHASGGYLDREGLFVPGWTDLGFEDVAFGHGGG